MTKVKTVAQAFDVARFKSFEAFQKAGSAYVADYLARGNQLSKVILAAGVLDAMRSPGANFNSIADGAFDFLNANPETLKNYRSQLVRALAFAHKNGSLPVLDANASQGDALAQVAKFCDKYTLRGLYDAARAPGQAKAEENKAARVVAQERAEADARASAGVAADAPLAVGKKAMRVADLFAALQPWQASAEAGNEDAIRVLAALEASLYEARIAREAASASEGQAQAA